MVTKATLTQEEKRMLDFAQRWYLYGGGDPEDIMVTFGVTPYVFYSRVEYLLARQPPCLSPSTLEAMYRVAQDRRAGS
ncbi:MULTISPECIES: DUF3263 domain-containing protein [Actinomycetes]|uniref:DUF3263 domain-containing protein n=1 Tax=Actinomycetes TaxID=1760 RepID=UPI0012DF840B